RPTLPGIASLLAVEVVFLFAGTVVIETVFSRPGLGRILVRSILQGDFPIAQALVGLSARYFFMSKTVSSRVQLAEVCGDDLASRISTQGLLSIAVPRHHD
ncbi:MAG: ABC transporter permease subunit, partial [Acidobacteriota bacterium]